MPKNRKEKQVRVSSCNPQSPVFHKNPHGSESFFASRVRPTSPLGVRGGFFSPLQSILFRECRENNRLRGKELGTLSPHSKTPYSGSAGKINLCLAKSCEAFPPLPPLPRQFFCAQKKIIPPPPPYTLPHLFFFSRILFGRRSGGSARNRS